MEEKKVLSNRQKVFLKVISGKKELRERFYLTGGTALVAFYLPYRISQDLDFFSEKEVDINQILVFLKSNKKNLNYEEFDFNTSFNRNIIQLKYEKAVLKLEFTYFPFPQIEKPITKNNIKIDSVLDIAVNKLFTIYQQPRSRDFMDLYMITKKYNYKINDLIKKAKLKFDWHVDPIKLGSQFLKAKQLKDYPKLLKKLDHKKWQEFFEKEAKNLETDIFS